MSTDYSNLSLFELQALQRDIAKAQADVIKRAEEERASVLSEVKDRLNGIKPQNSLSFIVTFTDGKVEVVPFGLKKGVSVAAIANGDRRPKGPVLERHEEIEPQSAYEWIFKGRRVVVERIDSGEGPKQIIIDGDVSEIFQSSGTALHRKVTGYNMDGGETLRVRGKRIK